MYSRKLVGWAMGGTMAQQLAIVRRQPAVGLLHHSDRGSQYSASEYQALLVQQQMVVSMSRRVNCLGNSPMESFGATLKAECAGVVFSSRAEARRVIFEYIEVWYNRARLHSALGYHSPAVFEQLYERALCVSAPAG
jgi:transposase InsO family protein